jgi:hypothetical protein
MCSGMMCLTQVSRCVYGQTDEDYPGGITGYGRAIERLKFDSSSIGGYKPYPRTPAYSEKCRLVLADTLYTAFKNNTKTTSITDFLTSNAAKQIYRGAANAFDTYTSMNPKYQKAYNDVKKIMSEPISNIRF